MEHCFQQRDRVYVAATSEKIRDGITPERIQRPMAGKIRHLTNAPIREAIIDVRTVVPDRFTIESLREHFAPILQDSYPTIKERRSFTLTAGPMGGEPKVFSANAIDGLFFRSKDGTRIVQTRLDGFSVNRLRPYDNYQSFKAEAQQRWKQFCDFIKPEKVLQLGFRYINDLEISSSMSNLSDVFDSFEYPTLGNQPLLESFFMSSVLSRSASPERAHVSIEAPPRTLNSKSIIFDIDVFRRFETSPNESELWTALDSLHGWKNEIFFGFLKESHLRRYE